ncbi:MAG: hypothetical protein ABJC98_23965 [Bacteroidota bacterium]
MKYFIILLLSMQLLISSCKQNNKAQENKAVDAALQKTEEQKGSFDPAYFKDSANAHLAIELSYANNQFAATPGTASFRPGRSPYPAGDTSHAFVVRYKDANGKIVGSYSFDNPGLLRACDGSRPQVIKTDNIHFEILVPANKAITTVEISNKGKTISNFTVPTVMTRPTDSTRIKPVRIDSLK